MIDVARRKTKYYLFCSQKTTTILLYKVIISSNYIK